MATPWDLSSVTNTGNYRILDRTSPIRSRPGDDLPDGKKVYITGTDQ